MTRNKQPTTGAAHTKVLACFKTECGHPLAGLFVLFRPRAPDASSVTGKIARVARDADSRAATSSAFILGRCDSNGYLGDAKDPKNRSDSYKLSRGMIYELYLVHHPSMEVATRLATSVNEPGTESYEGAMLSLEVGKDGVVKVPVRAKSFLPRGAEGAYGGYVLFHEMPLSEVGAIKAHVEKLQDDLGRLRYIVGGVDSPYTHATQTKRGTEDMAAEPLKGELSKQTMNAIYAFQSDARGGGLARCLHSAPVTGWDFVEVETADGKEVRVKPDPLPEVDDGVVDATTARAIAKAVQQRLRKPGDVMVELEALKGKDGPLPASSTVRKPTWLRVDAAKAYVAWDGLVIALGAKWGVDLGLCTFRSIFNAIKGAGAGKAAKSLHKTGCAIDLQTDGGYKPGAASFPVVMVHHEDDSWTLYIPSSVDPHVDETALPAELEKIRAGLVAAASAPDDIKHEILRQKAKALLQQLDAIGAGSISSYYSATVEPWRYDHRSPTGGTQDPPTPPTQGRSWLDITKVARISGLFPIRALRDWDANIYEIVEARNLEQLAKKVPAATWGEALELEALEAELECQAPRVKVLRDKASSLDLNEIMSTDIDLEFLNVLIAEIPTSGKTNRALSRRGSQITLKLTGKPEPPGLAELKAFLHQFPAKRFLGECGVSGMFTGAEWSTHVEQLHASLLEEQPAKRTDGKRPSKRPEPLAHMVMLMPDLSRGQRPQALLLAPSDKVKIPIHTDGVRRSQEWWHFQLPGMSGDNWFEEMARLGWRKEVLLGAPIEKLHGRKGLGYSSS